MIQLLTKTMDQRVVLQGTWEQFKLIQQMSQSSPGVRLAFYDEEIEIFMPGRDHEFFSRIIGYLVMTFCFDRGIRCTPTGSMTQEREGFSSVQADESYCINGTKPTPDLSIEVIFTSGSAAKLTRYQVLGVPEVWFWEDGVFTLYRLFGTEYQSIDRSQLPGLETLDIALLSRCVLMAETDEIEAVNEFRKVIQNQKN